MVPSLDGLAPFQIGFVVGDLERAARNSTSDRQPAPGGDGSSARKVAGASTKARRPNGPATTTPPPTCSASWSKPLSRLYGCRQPTSRS